MKYFHALGAIAMLLPCLVFAKEMKCTIHGVYENQSGELVPREDKAAIGKSLFIDLESGVVSGYFGTDGDSVEVVPVSEGFLTIERAKGVLGSSANRMYVKPKTDEAGTYVFTYNKNWFVVSGLCSAGT